MEPIRKKQLEDYFYVFLGGFLGFLAGLFFLHFIHYLTIGGVSVMEEKIDLISFFRETSMRQVEALGILLSFSFLGTISGVTWVLGQKIKSGKKRIKLLKEVSQAKTEFVTFTTHQLRAPLSALKFSLKMFQEGDFGKLNEEQQKIAKSNFEAVETLLAQISNLLDISKIELGKATVTKTRFSLGNFLISVKKLLQKYIPLAQEKNIVLDYFIPKEIPPVFLEVDRDKISQVLESLLENAINYTPLDGKIFLKIRPESNFLTLAVSDTGIGISPLEQGKIFTKFFRAANAKKLTSKGTGLGLYLAKFFVEGHGGKIWFESKKNWGTTFYFTLPYYQPKVAAEKALERL